MGFHLLLVLVGLHDGDDGLPVVAGAYVELGEVEALTAEVHAEKIPEPAVGVLMPRLEPGISCTSDQTLAVRATSTAKPASRAVSVASTRPPSARASARV